MALLPQSPAAHVDVAFSHINPVAAVHILLPHTQLAKFGSLLLNRAHSGTDIQRQDWEEEQDVVEESVL